jgi:SOS response regulatory protein OraA/RecX
MTPQEELFQTLYNHEKLLVKDMEIIKLREHREELSKIAFEAKARLVAADDEMRERTAKTKNKDWLTSVNTDQATSDAINVIETRKKRMSKMDKLRADLKKSGIDDATINDMIRGLEAKATESTLKQVTFKKVVQHEEIGIVEIKPVEEKKPFDATSLKFGA